MIDRIAFGLSAALALAGPAAAQAPSAAPGMPVPLGSVPVGPVTGQPERDTMGFVDPPVCALVPVFSPQARPIGTPTGSPEGDTYGYVVEGVRPCLLPQPPR